jgi:hypothetical protein
MAYIIDKETKMFWKAYGQGLTSEIALAHEFADSAAHALLRLFCDEVTIITRDDDKTRDGKDVWIEHHWKTEVKSMPMRTKLMRDKELVWVAYDGLWMATDRQSLILGTLLAYNTPTPFKPEPMAAA